MAEIKWNLANSAEEIKSYRSLVGLNKEEIAKELESRRQIATKKRREWVEAFTKEYQAIWPTKIKDKAEQNTMSRPKNQRLYISTAQHNFHDDLLARCEALGYLRDYDPKKYFYVDEPELISGGKKPPSVEAEEVPDIDPEEWLAVIRDTIPHGSENVKE
ncbi:MAG: hypothetical protein J6D42_11585 [Clostridia bacterium]|nr:hypothetical protein [Clostridia bacterium]